MILTRLLKLLKINLSYLELFNQSFYHGYLKIKGLKYIYVLFHRVVTKISSRRGIKQLGISFVLFFFYFPIKVAGATLLVAGENPRLPALNDNPENFNSNIQNFLLNTEVIC